MVLYKVLFLDQSDFFVYEISFIALLTKLKKHGPKHFSNMSVGLVSSLGGLSLTSGLCGKNLSIIIDQYLPLNTHIKTRVRFLFA